MYVCVYIYIYIYIYIYSEACTVMSILIENGHSNPNSKLDEAICTSPSPNIFGNEMHSTLLPPVVDKE